MITLKSSSSRRDKVYNIQVAIIGSVLLFLLFLLIKSVLMYTSFVEHYAEPADPTQLSQERDPCVQAQIKDWLDAEKTKPLDNGDVAQFYYNCTPAGREAIAQELTLLSAQRTAVQVFNH